MNSLCSSYVNTIYFVELSAILSCYKKGCSMRLENYYLEFILNYLAYMFIQLKMWIIKSLLFLSFYLISQKS